MAVFQGFFEDEILVEFSNDNIARSALSKAEELAMLGLPEKPVTSSNDPRFEIECTWTYSGLQSPDLIGVSEGAVWVPSEESLRKKELELRPELSYLPEFIDWSCVDQDMSNELLEWLQSQQGEYWSDASYPGYKALKVSGAHAALLAMSSELGDHHTMLEQMSLVAKRVHARCQMSYLGQVRAVWEPYLLSGWLRERLGVTTKSVQEYTQSVLKTIRARLTNGAMRLDQLYAGFSMKQLVEHIDHNTVTTRGYSDEDMNTDAGEEGFRKDSIMRASATPEQIEQAEVRLGRILPSDMKDFYLLTNACGLVRCGHTIYFDRRLLPLENLFHEQESYMGDSPCYLLPHYKGVEIDSPGVCGGAISMYEHNGQGTRYVWFVTAGLIRDAKQRLRRDYEAADATAKASIDQYIIDYYGSHEVNDSMNEYCIYQQEFVGESEVFPTFRAYLLYVAYESRHQVERSPLQKPEL